MERKFYETTVAPATAITHTVIGKLEEGPTQFLITSRNVYVDIYEMSENGLKQRYSQMFPYSITLIQTYRVTEGKSIRDFVIILTSNHQLTITRLEGNTLKVVFGISVEDRLGRKAFYGALGVVMQNKYLILYLYNHQIKIISLPQGDEELLSQSVKSVRIDQERIVGMHIIGDNQIALHSDQNTKKTVVFYEVKTDDFSVSNSTEYQPIENVDFFVAHNNGFFVVQNGSLQYHYNTNTKSINVALPQITIATTCFLDNNRLLLCDNTGKSHLITLRLDVEQVHYYPLPFAKLSIPSKVVYLDNGVLFWGSSGGNSYLIKIGEERMEVLETFENRGPILDMITLHDEISKKDDLLICSNTYHQGTLKLLRSGVGVNILGEVEYRGIEKMWKCFENAGDMSDDYKEMYVIEGAFGSNFVHIEGRKGDVQIVEIANSVTVKGRIVGVGDFDGKLVVVTNGGISIARVHDTIVEEQFVSTEEITHCVSEGKDVVYSGRNTVKLFDAEKCVMSDIKRYEEEISSIGCYTVSSENTRERYIGVGRWEHKEIEIIDDQGDVLDRVYIGDVVSKSIKFVGTPSTLKVIIGLGDGRVVVSNIRKKNSTQMEEEHKVGKVIEVGMGGVSIDEMAIDGKMYEICVCERPTLMSLDDDKIKMMSVNIGESVGFLGVHITGIPNSVLIASKESLMIGSIEEVKAINTKSLELGVFVSRVVVSSDGRSGVLLSSEIEETRSGKNEVHFINLIDLRKMEIIDKVRLDKDEHGMAIDVKEIEEKELYIVGTAYAKLGEVEPSRGRFIIFEIHEEKIIEVSNRYVDGAVYSVKRFENDVGNYIAATIQKKVVVYQIERKIVDGKFAVTIEEKGGANVKLIGLFVKTLGHEILVGDLMKSISVFKFDEKATRNAVVETCRDFYASYTTAVEFMDEHCFMSSDSQGNLLVFTENTTTTNENEKFKLQNEAHIHVGECINVMCKGSIAVMNNAMWETQKKCMLFGGICGSIGGITEINLETYKKLFALESEMLREMKGVIECESFGQWKMVFDDWKRMEAQNVIDGNVVELFLDLPKESQKHIAEKIGYAGEELVTVLESMNTIFH
ncbi:DNA damage-binding protein, putative [Entamoeba invadens IP1]|uniref:DNA damage-binding protein 1 n=1 Tax=Entamoeba invadens IP1 TaxID=370355 RepID=A0A0A1UBM3_ENTIV|nr:DNA damage-binding protein, putative [Entamoeba invadens IP1]ELP92626.1 DNA damage-binding protein, putative [Entamoeba invadens IP1]|eukprot:XP_004259397.1 DNA damage-binding protein, putative [Entamoeba invadens IP1]